MPIPKPSSVVVRSLRQRAPARAFGTGVAPPVPRLITAPVGPCSPNGPRTANPEEMLLPPATRDGCEAVVSIALVEVPATGNFSLSAVVAYCGRYRGGNPITPDANAWIPISVLAGFGGAIVGRLLTMIGTSVAATDTEEPRD